MSTAANPERRTPMRAALNPATLAVVAGIWLASVCNWPLWRAMNALPEMHSTRGVLFMLSLGLMIAALCTAVLLLLAWRRSIKPAIALLVLAAAFGAHFMGSYGVVIDPTMMVNVLNTDVRETRDLLSLRLAFGVIALAGVPLALLWRTRVADAPWGAQALRNALALVGAVIVLGALVVLSFADLSSTMRNNKSLRYMINPANSFYSLGRLAAQAKARPAGPPLAIGTDVRVLPRPAGARPPLMLLMVGETARADHFSANGYARPTNAETAPLGLVSFRDVTSCGTNTAASLPCMFSHLGREAFIAREQDHENLLDLLQRAGLAVLWLDNQSGCKGLCTRVPNAMASAPPPGIRQAEGLCDGDECLDEALLTGLDERLAALPEARRAVGVVLVMHQMGSHGPAYYKRSPPGRKPFMPECATNVLQQCPPDQLINAFDNSIAYTDHVLARGIAWLVQQQAHFAPSMLYVSDHGESLGENNLYLHGMPYAVAPREQTHVPMLMWLPPQTEAALGVSMNCLRRQQDTVLTHDHLFHTVMGLVGVASAEYRPALDVLQACRAQ
jgi:lipid A ethanolaminephosphotransferase